MSEIPVRNLKVQEIQNLSKTLKFLAKWPETLKGCISARLSACCPTDAHQGRYSNMMYSIYGCIQIQC